MTVKAQIRRRAEVMQHSPVLIEHLVVFFDLDVEAGDFAGFGGFPIVIGQRDDFTVVGEGIGGVGYLIHGWGSHGVKRAVGLLQYVCVYGLYRVFPRTLNRTFITVLRSFREAFVG